LTAAITTARQELSSLEALSSGNARGALQRQINAANDSVLGALMGEAAPSAIATDGSPGHEAVAAWAHTHAQLRERSSGLLDEATASLRAAEEQVWAELHQAGANLEQRANDAEV